MPKASRFSCPLCNRGFTRKHDLMRHHVVHLSTEERAPYLSKCEECGKTFMAKTSLDDHERIHTGERLSCQHAGCIFKTRLKSALARHVKRVHRASFSMFGTVSARAQDAGDAASSHGSVLPDGSQETNQRELDDGQQGSQVLYDAPRTAPSATDRQTIPSSSNAVGTTFPSLKNASSARGYFATVMNFPKSSIAADPAMGSADVRPAFHTKGQGHCLERAGARRGEVRQRMLDKLSLSD